MRRDQASLTAAGIAMLRALESERPEAERVVYDPYARQFVPGWMFWIDRSILEKTERHGEVASLRRYRRLTGEGLTFGSADGTVASFMTGRGFAQVRSMGSEDLRRLYFTGRCQGRRVASGYGIVSAVVP